jgi:hypothetical protein|tara:strand:- start:5827 stop:6039 length:213 start_codon:yes stop_codon:yes gene_type:complete
MEKKIEFDFEILYDPPSKIEVPLDKAIKMLKYYKKEMPWNLYKLTSKQAHCLKRILAIIEGLEVPERFIE